MPNVCAWLLLRLPGPGRGLIVAGPRQLPHVLAHAVDYVNLPPARAGGTEREVPAVGGVRRALVAAFAKRDLPALARRQVEDLDVEPAAGPGGVCDLVERRRR